MDINNVNNSSPVKLPAKADSTPPKQRNAEFEMLVMINKSQKSIVKQQEVDTQNVMVQTNQELAIYNEAKTDLDALAKRVEGDGSDKVQQDTTLYNQHQADWQTMESQWQGYVSGATSNSSQDSQNLSSIATLGQSATSIQQTTQQLMTRFN
jgi:hypothetical protein